MGRTAALHETDLTLADLLERLGGISPGRVRLRPAPGTATDQDVLDIEAREGRLYELIDGVLVEKVKGFRESFLAMRLGHQLSTYLSQHNLGILAGEAGILPKDAIPNMAPDLAIEVPSKGNTAKEIKIKLCEYFQGGTRLVWYINPRRRVVTVHPSPDRSIVLDENLALDGGDVLPGFSMPLRQLFEIPSPPAE